MFQPLLSRLYHKINKLSFYLNALAVLEYGRFQHMAKMFNWQVTKLDNVCFCFFMVRIFYWFRRIKVRKHYQKAEVTKLG